MTTLLLAIFIALSAALAWLVVRQRRALFVLGREWRALRTEEDQVFDFLHGLGEAFGGQAKRRELYRLIVEGAVRILDAHGGALYIADKSGAFLAPAYVSRACPPLVQLPARIREQAAVNPVALESYLRLHPVHPGEGAIGKIWKEGGTRAFDFGSAELQGLATEGQAPSSALVACLAYRDKVLGVLAVVNGPMSSVFGAEELDVFKAIAEQSAFALFSDAVYREVGEKRKLDSDLETAREIQSVLLPGEPPRVAGYDLAGCNVPARHVSGDYFDYLAIDEHRWGIAIADVSGKGIPAALITGMCRSVLRGAMQGCASAAEVLRRVNRQLYPDVKEDMFVSLLYIIIDTRSGDVTLARAGHDPPLVYRAATREVSALAAPGMAMGVDSGDVFDRVIADEVVKLEPGDGILLYTDGATEALDAADTEFGTARLTQSLQANAPKGAVATVRNIAHELAEFAGDAPQHDDITLIFIRKT
ncbi:MAG: GAF domain-containing protein [Chthoniobacterales bacterium]|nr:GAF domain-containing protein [Chthoniobacterales bacterium]